MLSEAFLRVFVRGKILPTVISDLDELTPYITLGVSGAPFKSRFFSAILKPFGKQIILLRNDGSQAHYQHYIKKKLGNLLLIFSWSRHGFQIGFLYSLFFSLSLFLGSWCVDLMILVSGRGKKEYIYINL